MENKNCNLEDNSEWIDCDIHKENCFALRCNDCGTLFRDCEDNASVFFYL